MADVDEGKTVALGLHRLRIFQITGYKPVRARGKHCFEKGSSSAAADREGFDRSAAVQQAHIAGAGDIPDMSRQRAGLGEALRAAAESRAAVRPFNGAELVETECPDKAVVDPAGGYVEIGVGADHVNARARGAEGRGPGGERAQRRVNDRVVRNNQRNPFPGRLVENLGRDVQDNRGFFYRGVRVADKKPAVVGASGAVKRGDFIQKSVDFFYGHNYSTFAPACCSETGLS